MTWGSWTAYAYGHPRVGIVEMLRNSVSMLREPKQVWVAGSSRNFFPMELDEAVYGTGWDGDIVLETSTSGDWKNHGRFRANNFPIDKY